MLGGLSFSHYVAFLAGFIVVFYKFSGKNRAEKVHVDGEVAEKWRHVEEVFRKNLEQNWERAGAAFVVYHKGQKVVDIWGGYSDRESQRKWTKNTLSIAFSCTKAIGAIVIAKLVDENRLQYDDLVTKYWPEFGKHGKQNVTIRWLITHKAGLAYLDHPVSLQSAKNPEEIDRILAEQKPNWPPGTEIGYHAVTHGWLVDAIVRRVDVKKRTVGQYFREEISQKHEIEFYLGLPLSEQHRVSRIENPSFWNVLEEIAYSPSDYDVIRFMKDKIFNGTLSKSAASTPFVQFVGAMTLNNPDLHRIEQTAVLGIGTARSLAQIFELLRLGKIVSKETMRQMFSENYEISEDYISGAKVPRGQGFMLKEFEHNGETVKMYGHSGYGGQNIRTDFDNEITISYLSNGLKVGFGDTARTYKRLLKAVYDTYFELN
ncbi:CRE-LACT-4 protein [Caenorhabditis remanei]|uniref:CRE-LACT-4 protein n=1 Tax=Caenorhabditis remanei TaxID=31234 RepID=E3LGI3_CAERE|nr:CRE-LACT-4 protein [Caenorhabditis remanei]